MPGRVDPTTSDSYFQGKTDLQGTILQANILQIDTVEGWPETSLSHDR
jgi:hypothetical protein